MPALTANVSLQSDHLVAAVSGEGMDLPGRAVFVAWRRTGTGGCALVPFGTQEEGSTVFLPWPADRLAAAVVESDGNVRRWTRRWRDAAWSAPIPADQDLTATTGHGALRVEIGLSAEEEGIWKTMLAERSRALSLPLVVWVKDLTQNHGWGALLPHGGGPAGPLYGDVVLPAQGWREVGADARELTWRVASPERTRIYQLLPRLFSNTNERRKPNGTAAENGVGKFVEITNTALLALRDELAITHVWLTGVLAQATATAFPEIGQLPDDPDLLKGIAGSPYAIRDYGEVSADYAMEPARRMEEFAALIGRIHAAGLGAIMDFVPNHVARCHRSALVNFGEADDRAQFFSPANNFFWLSAASPGGGPPLVLPTMLEGKPASPTCLVVGGCDGRFAPETAVGRVTGNNAVTWAPSTYDWYETVKLNYGYDFTTGQRGYPHAGQAALAIPDTWHKMDRVLRHWQELGVDGFRCDMAHMVPPEFWQWAIARARQRQPHVLFFAEAYNDDPMKVEGGDARLAGYHNVSVELVNAGFDAVYDHGPYKVLKAIYDGPRWANDLDEALGVKEGGVIGEFLLHRGLRYAENHDEVRLASRGNWGGVGMPVGRAVSALLYGIGRGPVLLYSGQEVGEPAEGAEGFCGDNGRTTIFDYWSMPELAKWVNGHRYDGGGLSAEQRELRNFYGKLLALVGTPVFRDGDFYPLNAANVQNAKFGRLGDEPASGHWLYAYLRHDSPSGEWAIVVVNLHATLAMDDVEVMIPEPMRLLLGVAPLVDVLSGVGPAALEAGGGRLRMGSLPPLTAAFFQPVGGQRAEKDA